MWKVGDEVWIKCDDDIFVARLVSRFPSDFSEGGLVKKIPEKILLKKGLDYWFVNNV